MSYLQPLSRLDIQQEQSMFINTNNIDGCIVVVAELLSVTMQIDQNIEEIRILLSENLKFYPEQVFAYLKNYEETHRKLETDKQYNKFTNFLDFDTQNQQIARNLINSSRDGIILLKNIVFFLQDILGYSVTEQQIQLLEQTYHTHQYPIAQVVQQAVDANSQPYPLPADIQNQIQYELLIKMEQQKQSGNMNNLQMVATEQVLNSGKGFNYQTFLKLFLSFSIPAAKNKTLKRKLIYEQGQSLQDEVRRSVAEILKLEVELHKKSEGLRIQLAQDPSYNPVVIFQALDMKRDKEIDYESMQLVMKRTQHQFVPKGFSALIRRSRILGANIASLKEISNTLTFDDFRQLTQVRQAYFKKPNHLNQEQDNNNTTVMISGIKNDNYQVHKVIGLQSNSMMAQSNYSQILGTTVDYGLQKIQSMIGLSRIGNSQMGQMNSKIRSINVDDPQPNKYNSTNNQRIKQTSENKNYDRMFVESYVQGKSQADYPLYYSDNINVTSMIKNQVQPNHQFQHQQPNDYIVYGTNRDYNDMQHNLRFGGPQQILQPLQQPQATQQNDQLIRPKTNFDLLMSNQVAIDPLREQRADAIAGEAQYQLKQQQFNQNMNGREVYNAQIANTKYQTPIQQQNNQQQFNSNNQFQQAPWRNLDKQTENNVGYLNRQEDEIKRLGGQQQTSSQPIIQTKPATNANIQQSRPTTGANIQLNSPPRGSAARGNSARHQIFGELSNAQQPLQYTDLNHNNLLNHNFDGRSQIQPRFDNVKI